VTPTVLASGATVPVPDATIRVEMRWDPAGLTVDLTGLLLGADGRVGLSEFPAWIRAARSVGVIR
jgi:hypothetical protein